MEPEKMTIAMGLCSYFRLDRQQPERQQTGVTVMVWKPVQCYVSLEEAQRARYEMLRYDPHTVYRIVKTIDEEIDVR